jgi:putative nucleotidyltransferase with HDIG domain
MRCEVQEDLSVIPDVHIGNLPLLAENDPRCDTVVIPVRLCNLPPFYPVASRLLALSSDPSVDTARVTSIAGADPAMAAEVLFLANSSLFGFPSRIRTLAHAVALLGMDRIKALAVTVAVRAMSQGGSAPVQRCWQHSVATAAISSKLSATFGCSENAAYTAGLLHDIGRLGLLKQLPRECAALDSYYTDGDASLQAERVALNIDHRTAGSYLAEHWTLPESFGEICEHHHDPIRKRDPELLQTVKLACRMATVLGFSAVRFLTTDTFADLLGSLPGHLSTVPFPSAEELRDHVEEALKILGQ